MDNLYHSLAFTVSIKFRDMFHVIDALYGIKAQYISQGNFALINSIGGSNSNNLLVLVVDRITTEGPSETIRLAELELVGAYSEPVFTIKAYSGLKVDPSALYIMALKYSTATE